MGVAAAKVCGGSAVMSTSESDGPHLMLPLPRGAPYF